MRVVVISTKHELLTAFVVACYQSHSLVIKMTLAGFHMSIEDFAHMHMIVLRNHLMRQLDF